MRSQIALAANGLKFMLQHPSSIVVWDSFTCKHGQQSLWRHWLLTAGCLLRSLLSKTYRPLCCLFDPFCNQKSAHRTTKTARHAVHWSTAVGARSCSRGHAARPPANTNNIKSCNPHAANQAVHTRQVRLHTKRSFVNASKAYVRHLPSDAMGC